MAEVHEIKPLRTAGEQDTRNLLEILKLIGPEGDINARAIVVQSFMGEHGFIPEAYRQVVVDLMTTGDLSEDHTTYKAEYEKWRHQLTP